MISIKTGCCLKASSCQAELPLRHRHHNRGCPSHNSVWLAQGENGSLRRVRPAAGWQVCICEARRSVYLLSFCLLDVSVFSAQKATRTKWHREYSPWCEEANTCLHSISLSHTHIHTETQRHTQRYTLLWYHIFIKCMDYDYSNFNTITGLLSDVQLFAVAINISLKAHVHMLLSMLSENKSYALWCLYLLSLHIGQVKQSLVLNHHS